jgi:hypothetical protein
MSDVEDGEPPEDGSPGTDARYGKGMQLGRGNVQVNIYGAPEPEFVSAESAESGVRAPGRHGEYTAPAVGTYGSRELSAVLWEIFPGRDLPTTVDAKVLIDIRAELGTVPPSPGRVRAERLIERLLDAHRTVTFLRRFMPESLTTHRLLRALAAVTNATGSATAAARQLDLSSEADVVEYVALNTPCAERASGPWLARFVLELIEDAGLDRGHDEVREWATSINGLVAYNDELAARRRRLLARRLRLVASLHYSPTDDWPEALGAWLLYDEDVYEHRDFSCPPDRAGAEEALAEAVEWAMGHADDLGLPLERIDVAAPARRLLDWRPEEVVCGARLGIDHVVISRWSQRLDQSPAMRRATNIALRRLREIADRVAGNRLEWLSSPQVVDLSRLLEEFQRGRYTRGIGLVEHPGKNPELLELVLRFSPILLWPQAGSLTAAHQDTIDIHWERLPDAFLSAYRDNWANADGGPLGDVRAVWDDEGWLAFCKKLQVRLSADEKG